MGLFVGTLVIASGIIGGVFYMNHRYQADLKALSVEEKRIRIVITPGQDAKAIGQHLKEKEIIRSASAFSRYVDQINAKHRLQAGTYVFSPHYSVKTITQMLVEGKVDDYNLTLAPGRRLDQIKESLIRADFDQSAVAAALKKQYTHPLLTSKPAKQDLEGYIFPDTYRLDSDTTPEELVARTLDNFYDKLDVNGLLPKLKAKGLTLHQAITLASIVQQEVSSYEEQQKVAQVFLSRLEIGMPLGADPTFRYASYKAGMPDSVNIDSPYNTRIYKGLPPGPIGNFNLSAIQAVANPSPTNYLFFVAGDDGTTYFSHTEAEHLKLKEQHCIELCKL